MAFVGLGEQPTKQQIEQYALLGEQMLKDLQALKDSGRMTPEQLYTYNELMKVYNTA